MNISDELSQTSKPTSKKPKTPTQPTEQQKQSEQSKVLPKPVIAPKQQPQSQKSTKIPPYRWKVQSWRNPTARDIRQTLQYNTDGSPSIEENLEYIFKYFGHENPSGLPRKLSKGAAEIVAEYIISRATAAKDRFITDMKDAAQAVKGVYFPEGIEEYAIKGATDGPDRLIDLLMKGVHITDSLRSTLVIENFDQIELLLKELFSKGYETYINPYKKVINGYGKLKITPSEDIVNLYADPSPEHHHVAIRLVLDGQDDPVVKELQIMTPNMYHAKKALGWHLYTTERAILKFMEMYLSFVDAIGAYEILMKTSKTIFSFALKFDEEK